MTDEVLAEINKKWGDLGKMPDPVFGRLVRSIMNCEGIGNLSERVDSSRLDLGTAKLCLESTSQLIHAHGLTATDIDLVNLVALKWLSEST